jgi:hypothetical protein
MRRRWPWVVLVGALAFGVWLVPKFVSLPINVAEGYDAYRAPHNHPLASVVKDDRPVFRLDPGQPWRIEFGRGSGMQGLDTAKLDQDGRLVLHRQKWNGWQTATALLPPDVVAKVLEAVEANRLLELDKEYRANVNDGEQWVLWVQQGDREKAVYFDNHFPDAIVRFAEQFDAIVSGSVGPDLRWRAVPSIQSGDHQRELWESIRR